MPDRGTPTQGKQSAHRCVPVYDIKKPLTGLGRSGPGCGLIAKDEVHRGSRILGPDCAIIVCPVCPSSLVFFHFNIKRRSSRTVAGGAGQWSVSDARSQTKPDGATCRSWSSSRLSIALLSQGGGQKSPLVGAPLPGCHVPPCFPSWEGVETMVLLCHLARGRGGEEGDGEAPTVLT